MGGTNNPSPAAVSENVDQALRRDHADRILPITGDAATEWGRIAALPPRADVDGLIATTAIVYGLILVTRKAANFSDIRVSIINPWIAAELKSAKLWSLRAFYREIDSR